MLKIYLLKKLVLVQVPFRMEHWHYIIIVNLNIEKIMPRIIEIQNPRHFGIKKLQSFDKWTHERISSCSTDRHRLVSTSSRFELISKVCGIKEEFFIADMWSLMLQASASLLFFIGSISCIISNELRAVTQKNFQNMVFLVNDRLAHSGYQFMEQYLFAPSDFKGRAS